MTLGGLCAGVPGGIPVPSESPVWHAELFEADYGTPSGPCTETAVNSSVFARSWSKAAVTMDCLAGKANITML